MSTELVVGIGSRESPDHMTSPTTPQDQLTIQGIDYRMKQMARKVLTKRQSHD
jgi:hypothetical protein